MPNLGNDELREVERALCNLYRERKVGIIYDDSYGIWTEDDQTSVAAEMFQLMDQEETGREPNQPR